MNNRDAVERIQEMEEIFDRASKIMKDLESNIAEFESLQSEIKELEKYYTGNKWKSDFKLDEDGKLPQDLKRGVLSEDGICDLLERYKELKEKLK